MTALRIRSHLQRLGLRVLDHLQALLLKLEDVIVNCETKHPSSNVHHLSLTPMLDALNIRLANVERATLPAPATSPAFPIQRVAFMLHNAERDGVMNEAAAFRAMRCTVAFHDDGQIQVPGLATGLGYEIVEELEREVWELAIARWCPGLDALGVTVRIVDVLRSADDEGNHMARVNYRLCNGERAVDLEETLAFNDLGMRNSECSRIATEFPISRFALQRLLAREHRARPLTRRNDRQRLLQA